MRALTRREISENRVVIEIQNEHGLDRKWLAIRLIYRGDFQLTDPRNKILSELNFNKDGFTLFKCKVRGVFTGFSVEAPAAGNSSI